MYPGILPLYGNYVILARKTEEYKVLIIDQLKNF